MKLGVILAHPDDETLWCGGYLRSAAGRMDVEVMCCSIPRRDPLRALHFQLVCGFLGVRPILLPFLEPPADQLFSETVGKLITQLAAHRGYDHIITHGASGEYGHVQHMGLHHIIAARLDKPKSYLAFGRLDDATSTFVLSDHEWELKLTALRYYNQVLHYEGHDIPKYEALLHRYRDYHLNRETFSGEKLP